MLAYLRLNIMRGSFNQTGTIRAPGQSRPGLLFALVMACQVLVGVVTAAADPEGKRLATDRGKGNCLACHVMGDGPLAGNVGPPLVAMKARFPQRGLLFAQIWDATARNPDSRMPPFGAHGVLNKEEIELIVDYLYTL